MVTGTLGILGNILRGIGAMLVAPAQVPPPPAANNPFLQGFQIGQQYTSGPIGVAIAAVFLLVSVVVLMAGIMMVMGRSHWLAVTGSILAMLNLSVCCCLLGLPFGIWSLVVLFNEDVKNAFL
jgi:hypothetical protein